MTGSARPPPQERTEEVNAPPQPITVMSHAAYGPDPAMTPPHPLGRLRFEPVMSEDPNSSTSLTEALCAWRPSLRVKRWSDAWSVSLELQGGLHGSSREGGHELQPRRQVEKAHQQVHESHAAEGQNAGFGNAQHPLHVIRRDPGHQCEGWRSRKFILLRRHSDEHRFQRVDVIRKGRSGARHDAYRSIFCPI